MAGEQAAPLPGHAVTPLTWSLAPSIINYRTNAIYEISRPLRAEGATRATWTSADPPAGWLAGLSGDDPVLGGRLGRGHRAAQPAAAITPRPPTIPSIVGTDSRHEMRTTTKRRAGPLALVTVAAPVAAGRWSRPPASLASRRLRQGADFVQRFGRGATGRPAQAVAGHHRNLETAIASARPASWLTDGRGRRAGFAAPAAATPPGGTRRRNPAHPRLRRTGKRFLALLTGLRDGRMVSQLR
jgi:hypothetical protein